MIRFLPQRFPVSCKAFLAAGLVSLIPTTSIAADKRINECSRHNNKPTLAWLDAGKDLDATRTAAYVLLNSASHGLNPADYDAGLLARQFESLTADNADASPKAIKRFNRHFTRSVLCYLQNVSTGRLNPHAVHKGIWLPRQKFNQHRTLKIAFQNDEVTDLLLSAAPQSDDYVFLRDSLVQLHGLASREGDLSALQAPRKTSIKLYAQHSVIPAVRERLTFLGDLQPSVSGSFEASAAAEQIDYLDLQLEAAVRRFQERHGLSTDGVITRSVLTAMQVPMTKRIAQAELALERIRWYPRDTRGRIVRVNIPAFSLSASAPGQSGDGEQLNSKVIVGKAGRRHTPLFAGPLTRIEFSPMWYVPSSIAKSALLPVLRRNPGYLKRRDLEFRLPNGKTTQKVSAAMLNRLARNKIRLQQRSGPQNALGRVKFVLPNHRAIYLHDTNKRKLFEGDQRALSYGCVRVEKPMELAKLLLADNPKWDSASVDQAASATSPVIARTTGDTTVMLQYLTAVSTSTGQMSFIPDIYAMDKVANRAVKRWHKPVAPTAADLEMLARFQQAGAAG